MGIGSVVRASMVAYESLDRGEQRTGNHEEVAVQRAYQIEQVSMPDTCI